MLPIDCSIQAEVGVKDLPQLQIQCLCYTLGSIQCWRYIATFDLAHIGAVQICDFGKLLLREVPKAADEADIPAENLLCVLRMNRLFHSSSLSKYTPNLYRS
ncbi:hypothetical protein ASD07_29480 [Duganella sp. Root336D2]|nr:hypothetical protein ASD07_29480 [Duganella sp. Root336D2]